MLRSEPIGQLYLWDEGAIGASTLPTSQAVLAEVVHDDSLGPPDGVCACCGYPMYRCDYWSQEELFP